MRRSQDVSEKVLKVFRMLLTLAGSIYSRKTITNVSHIYMTNFVFSSHR